ncbi:MAG: hypothetical protein HYT22_03130 [Candidatus Niyogibacteria bacterium]|nr:hypothetical protein [Candidatus Niyogibacteria bacterium]
MATKDRSAIVSGMGVGMSIIQTLVGKAQRRGVPDEVVHSLATPEGDALLDQFVEIMASTRRGANDSNLYPITVDYTLSLERMIAAGHYDWKNDDITAKHFPMKGEGSANVEIQLVHFNRVMESETVIRELDTMGLRPATLEELLAFGAKYPDIQREFPIVALGSVWRYASGFRSVPFLGRSGAQRHLGLGWFEVRWDENYRFAAVRK